MTLTLVAGSASTALAAGIGSARGSEPCARGLTRFADGELHVVDDMISTAGTIEAAVAYLANPGCRRDVSVVATHLVCVGPAAARLERLQVRQLYGTNSAGVSKPVPARTTSIDLSPLLADAIRRLHDGCSLEPVLSHL